MEMRQSKGKWFRYGESLQTIAENEIQKNSDRLRRNWTYSEVKYKNGSTPDWDEIKQLKAIGGGGDGMPRGGCRLSAAKKQ